MATHHHSNDDMHDGRHSHLFNDSNPLAEQRKHWVMWLTLAMMVVELTAGWLEHELARHRTRIDRGGLYILWQTRE